MPSHVDKEKIQEIHEFIKEYRNFSNDDENKYTYMRDIFNKISSKYDIYRDTVFLEFLEYEINTSSDKHIILECLIILHNLIKFSRLEEKKFSQDYLIKKYFPLIKKLLETAEGKYEYSSFILDHIMGELQDFISNEQLCELYWNRLVMIISKVYRTEITDKSLWKCVDQLNKSQCKIKRDWRKWLIDKDEFSGIKNAVLKELSPSII